MSYLIQNIKKNKKIYNFLMNIYSAIHTVLSNNHRVLVAFLRLQYVIFNPSLKIKHYKASGVYDYLVNNNQTIITLEESKERLVYTPTYHNLKSESYVDKYFSPKVYFSEIHDCEIVGGNSFIIKGNTCLMDSFERDKHNRYDLRFGSLVSIDMNKNVAIASSKSDNSISRGIFLLGFGSHNYYHFTIELMSKFYYVNRIKDLEGIPLIVDEVIKQTPQFSEILEILNSFNREVIYVKKDEQLNVKKLLFISECTWMPINVKGSGGLTNEDCLISSEAIKYIAEDVKRSLNIEIPNLASEKIFISRRKTHLQRLVNESEISEIFQMNGFRIVYPEDLSFTEQVALFSKASVIAGTTGAAITNIIYCSPGTTLICIIPSEYNFNIYSTLAYNLGIKSIFLDADVVIKGKKISGDRFSVNSEEVLELLNNYTNLNANDYLNETQVIV